MQQAAARSRHSAMAARKSPAEQADVIARYPAWAERVSKLQTARQVGGLPHV
jgi:hypothetical protein